MLIVREKMSEIEALLPPELFMRVHKSFIVSLDRIQYAEGNMLSVAQRQIPIGETYRTAFWAHVKDLK